MRDYPNDRAGNLSVEATIVRDKAQNVSGNMSGASSNASSSVNITCLPAPTDNTFFL